MPGSEAPRALFLIIAGSVAARAALEALLAPLGRDVTAVETLEEARAYLGGSPPDCVVLDADSGHALRPLRDTAPSVPILLLLPPGAGEDAVLDGYARGATGCVAPLSLKLEMMARDKIVEAMGGTIHARSVLGESATFILELPLGRVPA
ncbi:hypothetical protein D7V97_17225 [Corallococcus sp. CA053C]|uniref:hypothetical protein n=1 Tax=Corallococcus sp. CA053C TaxID=2316732 RepID=UPI000EA33984|nr:hypothetical protein [Corallococcus sp. CA053C]RKH09257.1 hypothetical protein D7V97_17225 [Corallococcus sp. CA053C]